MVEHDRRQQLAGAQMASWIAQAAELQGITQPGRWSAGDTDRGQVFCIEAMMSHNHRFGIGQRQQCGPLPLGHWNACGHV